MRYLLLIYHNPAARITGAELAAVDGQVRLDREPAESGAVISSASLSAPAAATTVRVRDDVPAVTDGPFLQAKEHLAGYYLVECDTIEQASQIAARIPCGAGGAVEVRPVDEVTTSIVRDEDQ